MSTKLYNGIRFKSRNMGDILQQLISIRKDAVKIANELLTIEEIKSFIILNNLIGADCHKIYKALVTDLNSDCRTLLSINFNFTISLIPEKNGYVYGYYFADHQKEYFEMIEPFVEDYHYQNQCDKPDNISNREWNNRRKKWNKLLGYDSFTQDIFLDNDYTKEEMKLVNETHKILHDDSIGITPTAVRVPVVRSHAESIYIETEDVLSVDAVKEAIKNFPGAELVDDVENMKYPMPLDTSDKTDVAVGRIRKDLVSPNGINLWVSGDQIRKGAALNTLQIAEYMIEHDIIK